MPARELAGLRMRTSQQAANVGVRFINGFLRGLVRTCGAESEQAFFGTLDPDGRSRYDLCAPDSQRFKRDMSARADVHSWFNSGFPV